MTVAEVMKYIGSWAPPGVAWERDNVGLQVGDPKQKITKILLSLELSEEALAEALEKDCNLIITHHPFIFSPLKNLITTPETPSNTIKKLLINDIALFTAHTNIDYIRGGVSFVLAKKLGLTNIDFLRRFKNNQYKLSVFVPDENLQEVRESLFAAGAGVIGNYDKCSYSVDGEGTFQGNEESSPKVGKKGTLEKVSEKKLEVLLDKWNLNKVLGALFSAHPYEEPAYDVYPVVNENVNYGEGAIGELEKEIAPEEFKKYLTEKMDIESFRYTEGKAGNIKKVAVCGGSGSELINTAIAKRADVYITADIKYHQFYDAKGKITLVDAGHYETEIFILDELEKRLSEYFAGEKQNIEIMKYSGTTNPIKFYYNNRGVR